MTDMTPIQAQIVELRQARFTNAEIADHLGINIDTVQYQAKRLGKAGIDLPSCSGPRCVTWTSERIAQLKKLYAEGRSDGIIAGLLGAGISRNAVIGKRSRLGLVRSGKTSTHTKNTHRAPARKRSTRVITMPGGEQAEQPRFDAGNFTRWAGRRKEKAAEPPVIPLPPAAVWARLPNVKPVSLLMLTGKTCRWPIGDPRDKDFGFCGADPRAGSPYCRYHARIAYQPTVKRRAA